MIDELIKIVGSLNLGCDVISVHADRYTHEKDIHMNEEAFGLKYQDYETEEFNDDYNMCFVWAEGVRVFCLRRTSDNAVSNPSSENEHAG